MRTIAALYVDPKGCYSGLEGVEVWDETRDARGYDGPWPVVAHPPCERWGRYSGGGLETTEGALRQRSRQCASLAGYSNIPKAHMLGERMS